MRLIEVENCKNCPFRLWWDNEDGSIDWTCGDNEFTLIPDKSITPIWCKLKEKAQAQEASKV